jgi:hypothetical protein
MRRSGNAHKWYKTDHAKLYKFYIKLHKYGINEEQFNFLLDQQDNRCAICQEIFSEQVPPRIDHDHTCCPRNSNSSISNTMCGRCVRGLLCNKCNVGLGMLDDSVEKLISAVNYLQSRYRYPFDKEVSLEQQNLIYTLE